MKIGCIISMYDEIDQVRNNVAVLRKENCPIIVIQSTPSHNDKILEKLSVDHYELLPDLAGSKENYLHEFSEQRQGSGKISTIPARALCRNFSHGFTAAKNFDVDWWITIVGDVNVYNLKGIKKIIQKMIDLNRYVGVTRGLGLRFPDENEEYTVWQKKDTTAFFPQFFIVSGKLVKNGLFNDIEVTFPIGTEICLGDNLLRYCNDNSLRFWDVCYSICDYPAPKWIEGFRYAHDRTIAPAPLLGPLNWLRRVRMMLLS